MTLAGEEVVTLTFDPLTINLGGMQQTVHRTEGAIARQSRTAADTREPPIAQQLVDSPITWLVVAAIALVLTRRVWREPLQKRLRRIHVLLKKQPVAVMCSGLAVVAVDYFVADQFFSEPDILHDAHRGGWLALAGALTALGGLYYVATGFQRGKL